MSLGTCLAPNSCRSGQVAQAQASRRAQRAWPSAGAQRQAPERLRLSPIELSWLRRVLAKGVDKAGEPPARVPAGLLITVSPFKRLPKAVSDRIPRHAEGVARFFALPLAEVRTEDPVTA